MDTNVTITQEDLGEVLARSAMLVTFTTKSWTGEASDRQAVKDAADARGAKGDVGNFRKKLLANNDSTLTAVDKALGAAYRDHVSMTSVWSSGKGGPRLLTNDNLVPYIQRMGWHQENVAKAVQAFVAAFPEAKAKAIVDLGGMADESQYPSAEEIASRFGMQFDIEPLPGGEGFPGLPPTFAGTLTQRLKEKTAQRAAGAVTELWEQIRKDLSTYANQTRPDGKVFDTTVEKITGMPKRIRAFNVYGDAKLEAIAVMVERSLSVYDAKAVKDDKIRAWVHAEATRIVGMLP